MRVVTRPDFDGIVCDVLLREIFNIDTPTLWIEPYEIDQYSDKITENDIIANLPLINGCGMWFDHHLTNKTASSFNGSFREAPSAAGIIYTDYRDKFTRNFDELVEHTDRIDSGNITRDEVLNMEKHPYSLLASTISGRNKSDEPYWNHVVNLLSCSDINHAIKDREVKERADKVTEQDKIYTGYLRDYTSLVENTAVTDYRSLETEPKGNRFLVYSLFPEILVDMKIRYSKDDREKVIVSLGQNIFNKGSRVNLGELVSKYGGGGHKGAGSCSFHADAAEKNISEILDVLKRNMM